MAIGNGHDHDDGVLARLGDGRGVKRASNHPTEYYYVDGELRVLTTQIEDLRAALTEREVNPEACEASQLGQTEYSAFILRATPPEFPEIPELVNELRPDIDCYPHHCTILEYHVQFGPYDAPLAIDAGNHPQLWKEWLDIAAVLATADKAGSRVVIIDTGVLGQQHSPHVQSGIAQPSDPQLPAAPAPGNIGAGYGHGTFVAGVVLQTNPHAKVHVFSPQGSMGWAVSSATGQHFLADDDLAEALTRALEQLAGIGGGGGGTRLERAKHAAAQGLDRDMVLNLSLAGPDHGVPDPLPATREILDVWTQDLDAKAVAAAGNDHTADCNYPAAYPDVVSVGAVDRSGTMTDFTNYGTWIDEWRLGRNVVSTYVDGGPQSHVDVPPPAATIPPKPHRSHSDGRWNGFAAWSGTSFAAPRVSGEISAGAVIQPGPGCP